MTSTDPVLARRARIARLVAIGQRVGYLAFALAVILFVIGFASELTDALVAVIVTCLVVGSIVLAPAIVFGYAVRAAERDDEEHGRPTR